MRNRPNAKKSQNQNPVKMISYTVSVFLTSPSVSWTETFRMPHIRLFNTKAAGQVVRIFRLVFPIKTVNSSANCLITWTPMRSWVTCRLIRFSMLFWQRLPMLRSVSGCEQDNLFIGRLECLLELILLLLRKAKQGKGYRIQVIHVSMSWSFIHWWRSSLY